MNNLIHAIRDYIHIAHNSYRAFDGLDVALVEEYVPGSFTKSSKIVLRQWFAV